MTYSRKQFEQLPMFMSARQITTKYEPLVGDREPTMRGQESDEQVWRRKAVEMSKEPDFARALDANEVSAPIPLTHEANYGGKKPMVAGGHHRIAYNLYRHPDRLLPVVHHEDTHQAFWEETPDFPYT